MVDRVYRRNATQSPPQPPSSPSVGYPTDGNASQGIPATAPGDYWFYMITESLRRVVVATGRDPDHLDLDLLTKAVLRYIDDTQADTEFRMVVSNGIPAMEEI